MTEGNNITSFQEIYSMPFDTDKWDYDQFNNPNKFQWIIGTTPFSNWQFVVGSWGVYFSTIIGLKTLMSSSSPFSLRNITALHNLVLCLLSAFMFVGAAFDFINRWKEYGISECFCTSNDNLLKGRLLYITYIYYLSKYLELMDTEFF
nr:520_t:CDS:2 [Entrophospora candida]